MSSHVPTPDMQADLDDVLQVEDVDSHVIPVKVNEAVETRELPTKRIATRTVSVIQAAGTKLLSADPRRKFATIIGKSQDIKLGANQAQAKLNGAWVPAVVPFVITSVSEVWAIGDGADTDVSVIEEYWA